MSTTNQAVTDRASRRTQSHASAVLTAEEWPIAAGMLPFPAQTASGRSVRELGGSHWAASLAEVAAAGFDQVEITDTWLRPGDLSDEEIDTLSACASNVGLAVPAVALIRRSVIDPQHGEVNLDYSHRSIEAAAALGAKVVSIGLHEELAPKQKDALWFWTEQGPTNDPQDADLWQTAVARLRELGDHAESVGLLLSLEMYEDTLLGSSASAVRLVEEIDRVAVGLNPDTGNLIRLHRPVERWDAVLSAVLPYTNYWHVKNYIRVEDLSRGLFMTAPTSLELGLINYRRALGDAFAQGFRGVITCEHYGGDGLSVSATNRDYIRRVLSVPGQNGEPA